MRWIQPCSSWWHPVDCCRHVRTKVAHLSMSCSPLAPLAGWLTHFSSVSCCLMRDWDGYVQYVLMNRNLAVANWLNHLRPKLCCWPKECRCTVALAWSVMPQRTTGAWLHCLCVICQSVSSAKCLKKVYLPFNNSQNTNIKQLYIEHYCSRIRDIPATLP